MSDAKTLFETLADLGWSSEAVSGIKQGRRIICAGGHVLGVLTAGEVWSEIRRRRLIPGPVAPYLRRFDCECTGDGAST